VVEHLTHVLGVEQVPFEEDALWLLGRAADGSMRDAMSLTDQAIAFGEGKVLAADVRAMLGTLDHGQVYGVLQALLEGDARGLIEAVRHLAEQGPDWAGVLAEILNVLHRVAIAQALPDAVDNGQGDRDRVLGLAQALAAEDVQFYYQMGLIGRRDLPLAPDPRSGFEMVLLRMLAFRPADVEGAPRTPLKSLGISPATADSNVTAVAGAAIAAAPVTPPVAPAVLPVEPVTLEPAVMAAPAPTPVVEAAVAEPQAAPVFAAAVQETVEPVIDLPWNEPVAAPQPIVAEPVESAVEVVSPLAVPVAVVEEVAAEVARDDDDEPPLGDYDYCESDAENLDYDFSSVADEPLAIPEPLPAAQPASGLAADWLALFPRLGLSGLTASIAANCSLIEASGDDWLLHLDPAQSALFNATQQKRLNDALNQALERSINLRVEILKPEQETPAQAAARYRAERQCQAEASIHADPLVQQMLQQFGALIRAESIEPLNP
jgi:DNA polymerase-3 subunit gamma/tau